MKNPKDTLLIQLLFTTSMEILPAVTYTPHHLPHQFHDGHKAPCVSRSKKPYVHGTQGQLRGGHQTLVACCSSTCVTVDKPKHHNLHTHPIDMEHILKTEM